MLTPIRATECLGAPPRGATQPHIFLLENGLKAVVKRAHNPQGALAVANDFICCRLAERLALPVNPAFLVDVRPSQSQLNIPSGIHAGFGYYENALPVHVTEIEKTLATTANRDALEQIRVFDELVRRDDKPEILTYQRLGQRYFFAVDYGFAFGGTPHWSASTLPELPDPFLRWDGTVRLRTLQ